VPALWLLISTVFMLKVTKSVRRTTYEVFIAYTRGGHLVFDWDWVKNLLQTCNRLVGNKATSIKCQSWVSHVQIQCTIALVGDAQIEGKVSVTPKPWLSSNNRNTYYNTFVASAMLAYCQPLPEAPKNIRDQSVDG